MCWSRLDTGEMALRRRHLGGRGRLVGGAPKDDSEHAGEQICRVPSFPYPSESSLPFPLSRHTPSSSTVVCRYGYSIDSGRRLGDILALSRAYGKLTTSTVAPAKDDRGTLEVPMDSVGEVERPGTASVSAVQMAAEPVSVSEKDLGSPSESFLEGQKSDVTQTRVMALMTTWTRGW